MRQKLVQSPPSPVPRAGSPRPCAASQKKPPLPSSDRTAQSESSSPEKPSPLDIAMSQSSLLTAEATLASMPAPGIHDKDKTLRSQDTASDSVPEGHACSNNQAGQPIHQPQESAANPVDRPGMPSLQRKDNATADATKSIPDDEYKSPMPGSWCWEVDSSDNDTFELSSVDSETERAYAPDLERMVREVTHASGKGQEGAVIEVPGRGSFNLVEEIQPYDGPPLGYEAAEYWGPEWLDDDGGELDAKLATMTKEEAEAIVLGARIPEASAEEIQAMPGAESAWKKFPDMMPRAVAESRLVQPLRVAEETLDRAFQEVHLCKHEPAMQGQTQGLLELLGNIRETMDGIGEMTGQGRRRSTKAPGGKPGGLDARAILKQFSK
eukprot:jgi/Ulvmu1/6880/UM031_0085.1